MLRREPRLPVEAAPPGRTCAPHCTAALLTTARSGHSACPPGMSGYTAVAHALHGHHAAEKELSPCRTAGGTWRVMLSGRASRRKTSIPPSHSRVGSNEHDKPRKETDPETWARGTACAPQREGVVGEKRSTNDLPCTHAQPWTCPAMDGQQGSEGLGGEGVGRRRWGGGHLRSTMKINLKKRARL